MKLPLSSHLRVPRSVIRPEHLQAFSYQLLDPYTQQPYRIDTFQEELDEYLFPRGNLHKLTRVFHEFEFDDQRVSVPFDYKLRFTGKLYDEQKELVSRWLEHGFGLIQAPPRSGKCVVGSSLVITERGLVTIDQVQPGQIIETSVGPGRVSAHYRREADKTIRLRTRCGYEIHGTPEHPVLVVDETLQMRWLPLESVSVEKHKIAVACGTDCWPATAPELPTISTTKQHHTTTIYPTPTALTPELARLLGYLVGEGSLAHQACRITNKDKDLIADFQHCLRACFGREGKGTTDKRNGVIDIGIDSVYIRDYLRAVGLKLDVSNEQEVPWCVMQAPKHLVVEFLRAYFDSDGSCGIDGIEVTSASENLICQIQLLLLNFGIIGTRRTKHVSSPTSRIVRPYHRLSMHGADIHRFHTRVGFGLTRKKRYTTRPRKRDRASILPFVGAMMSKLAKRGRCGWYRMTDGTKRQLRLAKTVDHGRGDNTTSTEFIEDPDLLKRVALLDAEVAMRIVSLMARKHFWDDVHSVTEEGAREVYDITVPGQHSFVANGIVAHNTVMMTALICKLRQRTLMLAHLEDLCHQLEETIRKFTNVSELEDQHGQKLIGVLQEWDDFFPIATLTTYQCLAVSPMGRSILRERRNDFGMVMADEVHRVSTEHYRGVVETTNAAYRCGVTATPTRKDGLHVVVSDTLGPVVAVGVGEQLTVYYTWEQTGFHVRPFQQWTTLWNRLTASKTRDKKIALRVVEDVQAGHYVLITTERLAHLDALKLEIQKIDPDITVGLLSSRTKDREGFRAATKRGDYRVVIAMSKIVELGYNVPRWSCFHNILPMANRQNWYQRISRIRTPMEPAFKGDAWKKPDPIARIWVDQGHPAIYAYQNIVKKENDRLGFVCLNPLDKNQTTRELFGKGSQ